MQITAVICLAAARIIPVWVICFIIIKEATTIVAGSVLYLKKFVVHSNCYGKCATILFYTVIFAMILFPDMSIAVKNGMLAFLVLILILAAVGYLIKLIDLKDGEIYEKKSNKL